MTNDFTRVVMQKKPTKIYLQWGNDEELTMGEQDRVEVTWERERIRQSDTEYTRSDLVPQWHAIPTDEDGFGLWEELPTPCIVAYRDGTFSAINNGFDMEEGCGDIERHPQRYKYIEIETPKFKD